MSALLQAWQRIRASRVRRSQVAACWQHMRSMQGEAEAARAQAELVAQQLRGTTSSMEVFDRPLKWAQRDRSSALRQAHDPLLAHVTDRLLERLEDCVSKFPVALVIGGAGEYVLGQLWAGRAGIERVIYVDGSHGMLQMVKAKQEELRRSSSKAWPETHYVQADAESLPIAPGTVDVVISSLDLHWANDLPGAMAQCRVALKPDGLFLASMFGGDTLQELRIACSVAQQEREGGISPFVSPLAQVRDAGNLLTRAGMALPTVDVDNFVLRYASALELVGHLRRMGEGNVLQARRPGGQRRDTALATAAVYQSMFGEQEEGEPYVPATYQVMYMTGWSPAENQPKPAKRGSATVSFHELAEGLEKRGAVTGDSAAGNSTHKDKDS